MGAGLGSKLGGNSTGKHIHSREDKISLRWEITLISEMKY